MCLRIGQLLQWILAEGVEIKYSENVSALIFKKILFRVFVYVESITTQVRKLDSVIATAQCAY